MHIENTNTDNFKDKKEMKRQYHAYSSKDKCKKLEKQKSKHRTKNSSLGHQ